MVFLAPFYILLVTSLKPFEDVSFMTMWKLPSAINFSSIITAVNKLAPNLGNSFKMAIPATVISSFLGSINGYALSKWKFKGSNLVFGFLLLGMFIPYQSILIPLIQVIDSLGLYNTISGLVLVHVVYGLPMTTLMFRNFYSTIPEALIEASQVDGVGFFKTYYYIIFPLSITGFVVVGIWQFTNIWNEFLFAITVTGYKQHPIMVAVQNLSGSQVVEWNIQMAGALFAALPTMLLYMLAGKFFIKGLLAGSVKG
jgi:glucose/mannose transport system permease protein